jgi:hypothetical protein
VLHGGVEVPQELSALDRAGLQAASWSPQLPTRAQPPKPTSEIARPDRSNPLVFIHPLRRAPKGAVRAEERYDPAGEGVGSRHAQTSSAGRARYPAPRDGGGIECRKIFLGEEDDEDFLRRLDKIVSAEGAQVLAWSALPSHVLLRSGAIGLPTLMRRLMTGYVVAFNLRHRRHGHLFQNRYKSVVCEEEM